MARKSVVHPNQTDVDVFGVMVALSSSNEEGKIQQEDMVNQYKETFGQEVSKSFFSKSLGYFKQENLITVHGKGRGTYYTVNRDTNDLVAVDTSALGENFRTSGGPTVREMVRAAFNALGSAEKVAPRHIKEFVRQMFPSQNLSETSFGQVFTKMAKENEVSCEGEGKNRQYWRELDMIDGAAEPEVQVVLDVSSLDNKSATSSEDASEATETVAVAS